jgi:hypothetical protein
MIVKTKRDYLIVCFIFLTFCTVSCALALLFAADSIWGCVALLLFGAISGYSSYSLVGRTLIFDETGCSICFRGKQVHYTWNEIAVKRVEPFYVFNSSGYPDGGMFFSLYPCNKSASVDPQIYVSRHVNTSFWVYFKPKDPVAAKNSFGIYEVDKQEFLAQLDAWGVQYEHNRY